MRTDSDLYRILGVANSASEEEIRRAYRKLAREHHPDVNQGKAESEERFKQIAAAYDVLSSREKRALYDEFGSESMRAGFDPERVREYRRWGELRRSGRSADEDSYVPHEIDLSELLRRGGPFRSESSAPFPIDGEDLLGTVELDLATALRGTELELRVPSRTPCDGCAGTGIKTGSNARVCDTCAGVGRQQVVRGPLPVTGACASCGGTGRVHEPCSVCRGQGFLESEQTQRVRIPPGVDDGEELRLVGRGSPGLFGGGPGDFVIRVRLKPHAHFERRGLDLTMKLPVTLLEAHRGAKISVPTPHGEVQLKIPPRTRPGAKLRLRGKGVARGVDRGDLYAVVDVRMPDSSDSALTAQLEAIEPFYATPVRGGVKL